MEESGQTVEKDANKPEHREKDERKELTALLSLIGKLGFSVAGGIIIFFLLGYYADKHFSTGGLTIILGILSGVFLSFYWAYRGITAHLQKYGRPGQAENE